MPFAVPFPLRWRRLRMMGSLHFASFEPQIAATFSCHAEFRDYLGFGILKSQSHVLGSISIVVTGVDQHLIYDCCMDSW